MFIAKITLQIVYKESVDSKKHPVYMMYLIFEWLD